MQTTLNGAIALKDNKNIYEMGGKHWAKIEWLRLWPKNPRIIDKKNYDRLKNQIKELGVYKPLVITPDGEILGGNQRFRALQELCQKDKRYQWIWISVVEAWTDEERLKYALSDNFSAGEYTREKLKEVINAEQGSLFKDYAIDIGDKRSIEEFIDELSITEDELKFKGIQKSLVELGINDETIDMLQTLTDFNKKKEKLEEIKLTGKISGKKIPIIFWFDDEILFEQIKEIFGTTSKYNYNTEKFIQFLSEYTKTIFPTTEEKLQKIKIAIEKIGINIKEAEELDGNTEKMKAQKEVLKNEYIRLYENKFSKTLK